MVSRAAMIPRVYRGATAMTEAALLACHSMNNEVVTLGLGDLMQSYIFNEAGKKKNRKHLLELLH